LKTDDLINLLVKDLNSFSIRPSTAILAALLAGATLASIFLILIPGCRPDFTVIFSIARFPITATLPLFFTTCAAAALTRLTRPAVLVGPWLWMLLAVSILLAAAGLVEVASISTRSLIPAFSGWQFLQTLGHLIILSIAPLLCLVAALLQAAPTRPGLAGALAGLTAGGIAVTLHMAFASDDGSLFSALAYSIAMTLVCLTGTVVGTVFLKW